MNPSHERALKRILKAPLVKWPALAAKLDCSAQLEIARAADSDAERLILLGAYLSALANGAEHKGAHKTACRTVCRVRKAMGYSYPGQGLASVSW